MPATVIVGAQWGDEGKGKIVDLLAQDSDLVCRYNGGPNAGHTIVAAGETWKLRHMPSGILWGKECVIGAGCVVDPGVFIEELDGFEARGISTEAVRLSGNAHVIMPWHLAIDQAGESCSRVRRARSSISTTARILSSPRRIRSQALQRRAPASGRPGSTASWASRRHT